MALRRAFSTKSTDSTILAWNECAIQNNSAYALRQASTLYVASLGQVFVVAVDLCGWVALVLQHETHMYGAVAKRCVHWSRRVFDAPTHAPGDACAD